MNRQQKLVNGKWVGGIEWTIRRFPDGRELPGYTTNPVGGCQHGCRWKIGGKIAVCYAEDTANGIASQHYPNGFEHHYWHSEEIDKWKSLPAGTRLFADSMSDMMGHWVPAWQIEAIIDGMRSLPHLNFQLLTKNPKRYLDFDFPPNVWLGASSPPDFMNGKELTERMRGVLMMQTLDVFAQIGTKNIRFLSVEPITIDAAHFLRKRPGNPVDWIIIGAASIGREKVPPNEGLVKDLVYWADQAECPIFYKGNLNSLPWAVDHWREDFPEDLVVIK